MRLTNEQTEVERLKKLERKNADLEQIIDGLNKEVSSLKAIKDQMGALIGNLTGSNTASSPRLSTDSTKPEIGKERVKKEQSERRSSPCPGSKERSAKRPRTFVELD